MTLNSMIAMLNTTSNVKNSSVADDGDDYGADAHVKYFLFVCSSPAAAREQVGELRSETEFCAGTLTRNSPGVNLAALIEN